MLDLTGFPPTRERQNRINPRFLREKILVLLSQHESLEAEEISNLLSIGTQLAAFHLEELKNSDMAKDYFGFGIPTYWGIVQGGRAYLVRHGLLA